MRTLAGRIVECDCGGEDFEEKLEAYDNASDTVTGQAICRTCGDFYVYSRRPTKAERRNKAIDHQGSLFD